MAIPAPMQRPTPSEGDPPPGTPEAPPSRDPAAAPPAAPDAIDPAEHDLIRRAQAGEEAAFEALVRRHQQRAYRIARHMVPSEEDARDLAQEAFLRVFKGLERFDFQFGFATWLHRIVTNLAIDHLRRRRLLTTSGGPDEGDESWEAELAAEDQPSPSQRLESSETARRVRECIASLAPHFQAVLTLRELEGLPCTEIARIVGATHVTVRWRLHRGRKLFQEEWERRERAERSGAAPQRRGGSPEGSNSEGVRPVQDPDPSQDPS
jgi:RNA polymerase sigma-70 factor (ECF subfamily)